MLSLTLEEPACKTVKHMEAELEMWNLNPPIISCVTLGKVFYLHASDLSVEWD